MNKLNIFIDLDGTILDVSNRVYQIYKKILKKYDKKYLSKKEYIRLKRNKIDNLIILKKTSAEGVINKFEKEWHQLIEKTEFLNFDILNKRNIKILNNLKKNNNLILITLRKNKKNLILELKKNRIDKLFFVILSKPKNNIKESWRTKYFLAKKYLDHDSIFIGDTETDILVGKKLGSVTIAVACGMRGYNYLKKYKPDYLLKNFWEINGIFKF